ncbi:MAG: hypothetical protein IPL20_06710 [Saprospiraceae bacterium]|nr:hypothetical protein [Saprospiraceae bacterium]
MEADVKGGTSPYSYLWNTGDTSKQLENRVAGNYFVKLQIVTIV